MINLIDSNKLSVEDNRLVKASSTQLMESVIFTALESSAEMIATSAATMTDRSNAPRELIYSSILEKEVHPFIYHGISLMQIMFEMELVEAKQLHGVNMGADSAKMAEYARQLQALEVEMEQCTEKMQELGYESESDLDLTTRDREEWMAILDVLMPDDSREEVIIAKLFSLLSSNDMNALTQLVREEKIDLNSHYKPFLYMLGEKGSLLDVFLKRCDASCSDQLRALASQ